MTEHRAAPSGHRPTPVPPPTAIERARDTASDTARRTVAGIEANPLGILVGGLAVGVLAGALVPRSARERELLAPVGKRIGDSARAAAQAAREAGQGELANAGLTADAGRDQVKSLLSGLGKALATAGTAAVKSAAGTSAGKVD